MIDGEELELRFTHHAPKGDQAKRYTSLRNAAGDLADKIGMLTPPSREQDTAIARLEEAVFWANAAIARRE